MKYLKKFNESLSTVEQDIVEICYDITDYDGFIVGFNKGSEKDLFIRRAGEPTDPPIFNFNEIKEVCLRLKDYLGDRYDRFTYRDFDASNNHKLIGNHKLHKIDLNEDTEITEPINIIWINYK